MEAFSKCLWRLSLSSKRCHGLYLRHLSTSFNSGWLPRDYNILAPRQRHGLSPTPVASRDFSYVSWVNSIATSSPVLATQDLMIGLHDFLPCPWWATIVLTTVGIRCVVTFPFLIYQNYISARYTNLQPEIKQLAEELKKETAVAVKIYGWNERQARFAFNKSLRKHIQRLIERDNCHPFKASLVLWVQIPVWVSISFAFRNMTTMMPYQDLAAQLNYLSLSSGGLLWIPNLTVPDASLIFPMLLGVMNLAIVEIHALKTLKSTRFQKVVTYLFRGMSLVMVPIAASVPSCLVLYWTTSSCMGLIQNLILMSPGFRRRLKIPRVVGETETPFRDVWTNFRRKYLRKRS